MTLPDPHLPLNPGHVQDDVPEDVPEDVPQEESPDPVRPGPQVPGDVDAGDEA
jgi:hypothetical protein